MICHIIKEELAQQVMESSGHWEQADGFKCGPLMPPGSLTFTSSFFFFGCTMRHVGSRFPTRDRTCALYIESSESFNYWTAREVPFTSVFHVSKFKRVAVTVMFSVTDRFGPGGRQSMLSMYTR